MDQRFFQPLRIFALKLAELAYFWTIQPGIQFILPLKLGVEFYSKENGIILTFNNYRGTSIVALIGKRYMHIYNAELFRQF